MGCGSSQVFINFKQEERDNKQLVYHYENSKKYYNRANEQCLDILKNEESKSFYQKLKTSAPEDYMRVIRDFFDKAKNSQTKNKV